MKKIILGFILLTGVSIGTNAKPQGILEGNLSSNRTLTADSCYVLIGVYVVEDNATLTINAGVEILCEENSGLVILQGAKIASNGTSSQNVIFTSDQMPGNRTPDHWLGIMINGKAVNNITNSGGGTYDIQWNSVNYSGGGSLDTDNSGTMTYTQIHYAGGGTIYDNERGGLLLNGVGSGSTISNIEVAYSGKDGIALFGGLVDVSNSYILNAAKNDIYVNYGYRGSLKGILTMRKDNTAHDADGSNGLLVLNNDINTAYTPLTHPEVLNCTFIGPEHCNSGSLSSDFKDGISFDYNGGGDFYNNVLTGFKDHALYIADAQSAARTANDELNFSYNSMTNNGSGDYSYNSIAINPWNGCGSSMTDWISGNSSVGCEESDNQFSTFVLGYDGSFCDDYCEQNFDPNFVLTEDSELDLPSSSSIFDNRGAVQLNDLYNWISVCPQNNEYCTSEFEKGLMEKKSSLIIVPNPAQSQANLMFNANTQGKANVLIFDKVTGHVLFQKNITIQHIGEQKISISVKGLREGVYPIRVQMKNSVINSLISVQ